MDYLQYIPGHITDEHNVFTIETLVSSSLTFVINKLQDNTWIYDKLNVADEHKHGNK